MHLKSGSRIVYDGKPNIFTHSIQRSHTEFIRWSFKFDLAKSSSQICSSCLQPKCCYHVLTQLMRLMVNNFYALLSISYKVFSRRCRPINRKVPDIFLPTLSASLRLQ